MQNSSFNNIKNDSGSTKDLFSAVTPETRERVQDLFASGDVKRFSAGSTPSSMGGPDLPKAKEIFGGIVDKVRSALKKTRNVLDSKPIVVSPPLFQGPEYRGPTRANRNNNPLNIKASPHTMKYNGVTGLEKKEAEDGGQFLIFNSVQDGFNAAKRLIRTEGYIGLTVDQALKRWSNHGYGAEIAPPDIKNKIIGSLNEKELTSLISSMARHEGFKFNYQAGLNPGRNLNREPVSQAPASGEKKHLGVVTTPFGGATRYENTHPGIDIANKKGTSIPAFTGGIVVAVEEGRKQGDRGYGNYVIVKDRDGNQHRYSHLDKGYVKVGQRIEKGQPVGAMGNSGTTYSESGGDGSHLDYRVVSAYGKYMNPLSYINNLS